MNFNTYLSAFASSAFGHGAVITYKDTDIPVETGAGRNTIFVDFFTIFLFVLLGGDFYFIKMKVGPFPRLILLKLINDIHASQQELQKQPT